MAYDLSIITPAVAERNGLEYFEVVIFGWGDTNNFLTSPSAPAINLASAVEYSLPDSVSLFGASIGPLSTVPAVLLTPNFARFSSAALESPGQSQAAIGYDIEQGAMTIGRPPVTVAHPLKQTLPGTITLRSVHASEYQAFVAPNFETGINYTDPDTGATVLTDNAKLPTLHLLCWTKNPGPASYPSKRARYYDTLTRTTTTAVPGTPATIGLWPVAGRSTVTIDLFKVSGQATFEFDVLLHRKPKALTQLVTETLTRVAVPNSSQMHTVTFNDPSVEFVQVRAREGNATCDLRLVADD